MWIKPWKYKEGTAVALALALVGAMLQLSIGPIHWNLLAMPVNVIFLVVYIVLLLAAYLMRGRVYAVRWSMTNHAAVPAILVAGAATVVYGITCDRSTLSAWPFVLLYCWITVILGLLSLRQLHHLLLGKSTLSAAFSLVSHLGLFIALVAATLGSADMQKLKMTIVQDAPEWRAVDDDGMVHELDIAIQLHHFAIDEYPPKLIVIDNETGRSLPEENPASLVLEDSVMTGELLHHTIRIERVHQYCAMFATGDTVNYVPWAYSGATTAALVSIDGRPAEWISNGSYMFPYRPIRIDDSTSMVMPECEPRRFTSNVDVYAKSGKVLKNVEIEVNKPLDVDGWKVYQLSYDEVKGRWSETSVLELVRDPWLPAVYVGIFMLLAGAVLMFFKPIRHD